MSTESTNQPDLWTTGDVAREGRCSVDIVRVWVRTGQLPAMRTCNGQYLFRPTEALAFLEARRPRRRGRHA